MISKQIVEKFEGEILFESEKDIGSTFYFTFKLKAKREIEKEQMEILDPRLETLDQCNFIYKWESQSNKYELSNEVKYQFLEDVCLLHRDNDVKKILIADDQAYNIDAVLSILKYGVNLKDFEIVCEHALNGNQAFQMVI